MPISPALLERPENRILQLCARGTTKHGGFAAVLSEVNDWQYLVSQLHFHRLTLFFLHHVRGHEKLVPVDVLEDLRSVGDQILHWNLFLLAELQQVTRTLTERGLRILSYKGPSIAYSAYGTMALRRFVDLDFLVSPNERKNIISILRGVGYQKLAVKTALTPFLRRHKAKIEYEATLRSPEGNTFLDLHWSVTAPFESFPLNFEQMWERRVPIGPIPGVYTLGREHLIIALCFHGLKHLWEEMEWIGCLLNLIQKEGEEPLDWGLIHQIVHSSGCQGVLYVGLYLANDLVIDQAQVPLNAIVPDEIWRYVAKDKGVERTARKVWARILLQGPFESRNRFQFVGDYFLRFSVGMQALGGWRTRSIFFVGMLRTGLLSLEGSTLFCKTVDFLSFRRVAKKFSS